MIGGRAKSDAGMRGGGAGSIAGAGSLVAAARADPAVNIATGREQREDRGRPGVELHQRPLTRLLCLVSGLRRPPYLALS